MKRIGILILCFLLMFSCTSCIDWSILDNGSESSAQSRDDTDTSEPIEESPLNLDKDNCTKGNISFTFSLEEIRGEYGLYYADGQGKILPSFTKIADIMGTGALSHIPLPYGAKTLILVGREDSHTLPIPQEYLLDESDFVFGVLSDVHYNRYNTTGQDDALVYFANALDYFDALEVDFVGIAGDISSNGELSALEKFNSDIKDRDYPVYTVSGNHDVNAIANGNWKSNINLNTQDCTFAPNGLDFVYSPEEIGEDVFVFLCQMRWEYNTKSATLLDMEQLDWLRGVLEENKDDTVYLFFHTFLCGPDGQGHTGVGNIKNPGGYSYDLPYTYGAEDEAVFRELLKQYKNVIYLSGHSHWMFEMEIYGEWANYSDYDGEYCHMLHVPSVTEPRYIGENDTSRTAKNGEYSQGWIAYDYEECTVFIPVDFISGTYYSEYMEIIYK